MSSRFCPMTSSYLFDGYACPVCLRLISYQTILENPLPIVLECGLPSRYDMVLPVRPTPTPTQARPPSASMPNELIGQEGGRFDAMYLEDAS